MVPIASWDFPFDIMDVASLLRLNIRRRGPEGVYVDCPICGDKRGKAYLNTAKNVWRCNYCSKGGGMLALYGMVNGLSNSEAYREICDDLMTGDAPRGEFRHAAEAVPRITQSERASRQDIHKTMTALLSMLTLTQAHREHLRAVRGLSDEQIDWFGFKSTPNQSLCRYLAYQLIQNGCVVQGVPGFFQDEKNRWTIRFYNRTAGIMIPIYGIDGLLSGIQTRLDHPIKDKDDPPEKCGVKYLSLSSTGKKMGASCGSMVHFVGNPRSRVVYVTEGALKADIAYALTGRSFLATIGANNVSQLEPIFAFLRKNGTEEIIEAEDMDKYRNSAVNSGASKVYAMARRNGLACRRLTWNPRYKGIDEWQLALRARDSQGEESKELSFKERYLNGECGIEAISEYISRWRSTPEDGASPHRYLGLTPQEYNVYLHDGQDRSLAELLNAQRSEQRFRIYQIDLERTTTVPYAFLGQSDLRRLGYNAPDAKDYRLVYDSKMYYPIGQSEEQLLERIYERFNLNHPADYQGHSLSMSDVVELYDESETRWFYCDTFGFSPTDFSPELARPMKSE